MQSVVVENVIPPSAIADLPVPRPLVQLALRLIGFELALVVVVTGFKLLVGYGGQHWQLVAGRVA